MASIFKKINNTLKNIPNEKDGVYAVYHGETPVLFKSQEIEKGMSYSEDISAYIRNIMTVNVIDGDLYLSTFKGQHRYGNDLAPLKYVQNVEPDFLPDFQRNGYVLEKIHTMNSGFSLKKYDEVKSDLPDGRYKTLSETLCISDQVGNILKNPENLPKGTLVEIKDGIKYHCNPGFSNNWDTKGAVLTQLLDQAVELEPEFTVEQIQEQKLKMEEDRKKNEFAIDFSKNKYLQERFLSAPEYKRQDDVSLRKPTPVELKKGLENYYKNGGFGDASTISEDDFIVRHTAKRKTGPEDWNFKWDVNKFEAIELYGKEFVDNITDEWTKHITPSIKAIKIDSEILKSLGIMSGILPLRNDLGERSSAKIGDYITEAGLSMKKDDFKNIYELDKKNYELPEIVFVKSPYEDVVRQESKQQQREQKAEEERRENIRKQQEEDFHNYLVENELNGFKKPKHSGDENTNAPMAVRSSLDQPNSEGDKPTKKIKKIEPTFEID